MSSVTVTSITSTDVTYSFVIPADAWQNADYAEIYLTCDCGTLDNATISADKPGWDSLASCDGPNTTGHCTIHTTGSNIPADGQYSINAGFWNGNTQGAYVLTPPTARDQMISAYGPGYSVDSNGATIQTVAETTPAAFSFTDALSTQFLSYILPSVLSLLIVVITMSALIAWGVKGIKFSK